jgi:surface carbohydrate biosynthesis protein
MPRDIDVLWLIEHTAREMDVACVTSALGRARYGLTIEIRNIYQHVGEYLRAYRPRVVVHPFVYVVRGALATEDVYARWPGAIHFNLAWEQIHYRAHLRIKAPADERARLRTIHHGWGEFYRTYLRRHGVPDEHIFINGHPSYRLYAEPYRRFFVDRSALAKTFGLDPAKRWVFVPDNYRWAFAHRKLKFFLSQGGDARELRALMDFSVPSLEHLLRACREAATDEGLEIVVRPRPSVSTREFLGFFRERVGGDTGRIHFLKEGSVREWIMASDVVISSYSTSLIEAAVAGKPAWMFEPIPIPQGLYCEWYDHVRRVRDTEALLRVCRQPAETRADDPLRAWAHSNLLACGDPLQRLALQLALLVDRAPVSPSPEGRLPRHLGAKKYFNEDTHEKDAFSRANVDTLTAEWASLLASAPPQDGAIAAWSRGNTTNKTMDRDDLLALEAAPLVEGLNALVHTLYARGAAPASWVGSLSRAPIVRAQGPAGGRFRLGWRRRRREYTEDADEREALTLGMRQRLAYKPLPGAADDRRFPWFLYWEIHWAWCRVGPLLEPGMRLLDAGEASSLFACHMASRDYELHSVDVDEHRVANGQHVATTMGWPRMFSHALDLGAMGFPDAHFDHAFSMHGSWSRGFDRTQVALREIARCLKPGGLLALTFDYRSPIPTATGADEPPPPHDALRSEADIHRHFLTTGGFRIAGNPLFHDNWRSYLRRSSDARKPYTLGAIILQRR